MVRKHVRHEYEVYTSTKSYCIARCSESVEDAPAAEGGGGSEGNIQSGQVQNLAGVVNRRTGGLSIGKKCHPAQRCAFL